MKKYSIEIVIKLAKSCKTKKEFRKYCDGAYQWAYRNDMLNDDAIFGHMTILKGGPEQKYFYDDVVITAKKYTTRSEFQHSVDKGAYFWCSYTGNINDSNIFGHMVTPPPNRAKWNIENTLLEAKKYSSRKEFEINSAGAYKWARTNKVIDLVCEHMKKNFIEWDLSLVIEIAKKYTTRGKFITENSGAYGWIIRNKQKNNLSIFGHMRTALSGFNCDKPAILYYLKIKNGLAFKIGITNRTIIDRFTKKDLTNIEVLSVIRFANGLDAKNEETRIKKEFKNAKYKGQKLLKDGNSELFRYDILNLNEEKD